MKCIRKSHATMGRGGRNPKPIRSVRRLVRRRRRLRPWPGGRQVQPAWLGRHLLRPSGCHVSCTRPPRASLCKRPAASTTATGQPRDTHAARWRIVAKIPRVDQLVDCLERALDLSVDLAGVPRERCSRCLTTRRVPSGLLKRLSGGDGTGAAPEPAGGRETRAGAGWSGERRDGLPSPRSGSPRSGGSVFGADGFAAQHQSRVKVGIEDRHLGLRHCDGEDRMKDPLSRFRRTKGRDGRPLLGVAEFAAGERLARRFHPRATDAAGHCELVRICRGSAVAAMAGEGWRRSRTLSWRHGSKSSAALEVVGPGFRRDTPRFLLLPEGHRGDRTGAVMARSLRQAGAPPRPCRPRATLRARRRDRTGQDRQRTDHSLGCRGLSPYGSSRTDAAGRRYPLTTPSARPLKKSFCAKAKATIPGATTTT